MPTQNNYFEKNVYLPYVVHDTSGDWDPDVSSQYTPAKTDKHPVCQEPVTPELKTNKGTVHG